MSNSVTERIPYDWFEIDAIEGWLDEHVRQGLRLVNITPLKRAEFEPATGSLTRYRIHVKEEKDGSRDEEYHETFRELGWEFVAELNDQADIYQAIRPDAVEINTDEEVLRSVIDKVVKRTRNGLIVAALLLPFWFYQQIDLQNVKFFNGIYDYLLSNAFILLLDILVLSVWVILLISGFRRVHNIKKRQLLQRDYHTPAVAKRRSRPMRYASVVYISLFAILLLLVILPDDIGQKYVDKPPCPVAGLADVNYEEYAPAGKIALEDYHGEHLLYHYDTYRWDAPLVSMPGWKYAPYRYVVGVESIRLAPLIAPYLREYRAALSDHPWQEVSISGWDEAWYQSYETTREEDLAWVGREYEDIETLPPFRQQHLFLRDGNTIIHVSYDGATDLYPRLQELYGR